MGGKSAPAPDYGPLAQASKEAAEVQAGLGREQLAFARQQYAELSPVLRGIAAQQQAAQQEQMRQAQEYYDYQMQTYRPLEQGLVRQAQEFNTEAYRNQLAAQAAADAGRAFGATTQANQRAMASMGVNPNSGRFAGLQNQSNVALAAQRAAAMTGTRNQAQQMGYARQLDVAGLGRNLAGASTAAYGGAVGAGNAANAGYQSAGNQLMTGLRGGAATIGSGQQMQIQGYGNILNAQTSYANAMNQSGLDVGGLMQGAAALYTASDRRVKENIEQVGTHYRTGLPIYEFNYTHIPDRRFRGVMAQDVEETYPEAVVEFHDGIKGVNYDMLGMEMVEVTNAA